MEASLQDFGHALKDVAMNSRNHCHGLPYCHGLQPVGKNGSFLMEILLRMDGGMLSQKWPIFRLAWDNLPLKEEINR